MRPRGCVRERLIGALLRAGGSLSPAQELFLPLVKRLGFEYPAAESANDQQLRTLAIEQAADAGDPWYASQPCCPR